MCVTSFAVRGGCAEAWGIADWGTAGSSLSQACGTAMPACGLIVRDGGWYTGPALCAGQDGRLAYASLLGPLSSAGWSPDAGPYVSSVWLLAT